MFPLTMSTVKNCWSSLCLLILHAIDKSSDRTAHRQRAPLSTYSPIASRDSTFVLATMHHNCSDIGTIEVDLYINTLHAQLDAIQTINSDELTALMWFVLHRTKPGRQVLVIRDVRFVAITTSPRHLPTSVLKNQFLLDG